MNIRDAAEILQATVSLIHLLNRQGLSFKDLAKRVEKGGGDLTLEDLEELEAEARASLERLRNA